MCARFLKLVVLSSGPKATSHSFTLRCVGIQIQETKCAGLNTYVKTWLDLPGCAWRERLAAPSSGWSALPRIFRDLGFQNVEDDVVSSDRLGEEGRRLGTEIEMAVYASSFQIAGMSDGEIEAIKKPAEADATNGAYVRWDMHIIRGFKVDRDIRCLKSDRRVG